MFDVSGLKFEVQSLKFDVQSIVELHSREAPVKRPFDPFDPFDLTVTGNPQSNPAAKMAAFPDSVSRRQNTSA